MLPQRRHPAKEIIEDDRTPTLIFLTVCTARRRPWLADPHVHAALVQIWRSATHWEIGPYILMRDHLHLFACRKNSESPAINAGSSGASPHQRKASLAPPKKGPSTASPYLFFSIFRKNGAVLLTLLFATSSGDPVATTSPPNSPASGPISIR